LPIVQRTLEVERVVNLVAAFDWKVTEETEKDNKITITIEKTVPVEAPAPPVA